MPTTASPEAVSHYWFGHYPEFFKITPHNLGYGLFQTTWSSARNSKLLLEAGWSWMLGSWPEPNQPTVTNDHISINDNALGFRYNAPAQMNGPSEHPQQPVDRLERRLDPAAGIFGRDQAALQHTARDRLDVANLLLRNLRVAHPLDRFVEFLIDE